MGVDMLKMNIALCISRLCSLRPINRVHSPKEAGYRSSRGQFKATTESLLQTTHCLVDHDGKEDNQLEAFVTTSCTRSHGNSIGCSMDDEANNARKSCS